MPKEITDIKKFLQLTKGDDKDAQNKAKDKPHPTAKKVLFVKYSKKITKFKLRSSSYLYTYKTGENEKAKKLMQSLPQGLTRHEIKAKKILNKKKKR